MLGVCGMLIAAQSAAQEPTANPLEARDAAFFEAKVRPILVERCVMCHGPETTKAGLRLDRRASALEHGGDSGPAIEPGDLEASLLIEAIRYDSFLQMPPDSKLPDHEIATLTEWVGRGAPWPVDQAEEKSSPQGEPGEFDLEARASALWSFQPIQRPEVPLVETAAWPRTPVDRFILHRLEVEGLDPAPESDRRALIRRATFDLHGLPPSPEEIDAFLNDDRPDAYERLIDRLLASPRYGERWGRHWLDVVRYCETSGHEQDFDILEARRYRDYVIRAWNDDLPYDQFLIEHLAGDLIEQPRRRPVTGENESILATTVHYLIEGRHSPVDLFEEQRTRVDFQLDVVGKAFLGLTITCARCHDHKFDPISTADYYALAGYFQSSRHHYKAIDDPEPLQARLAELKAIRSSLRSWIETQRAEPEAAPATASASSSSTDGTASMSETLFESFDGPTYDGWFVTGPAFGAGPTQAGDLIVREDGAALLEPGWAHSGAIAEPLHGVLRSQTFTIERPFIHLRVVGRGGRIHVVLDGFEKLRYPIYGGLTVGVDQPEEPTWVTIHVGDWKGHRAYLELADGAVADYRTNDVKLHRAEGFLAIDEIHVSDDRQPPKRARAGPLASRWSLESGPAEARAQIDRYLQLAAEVPEPTFALCLGDGTPENVPLHIRGSTKNRGEPVPRRFLEALDEAPSSPPPDTSGRMALARKIASPENPLTARVLVNRLWHHHFGRGIVATPDDFGSMGKPPTHPELLDWLAAEFVDSGWSIKHLHRVIMTSAVYRMSSDAIPEADARDETNRLWHRRATRRLEAEAIRDAMLACSGRLDSRMFGPGVPVHLTPFMQGRGRPKSSGPLDGDGRRSLYLSVRRNFLPPFLLAFDFPTPNMPRGRRDVSNVPAQALVLWNDPFVIEQARRWADRLLAEIPDDAEARVERLYLEGLGRPPTDTERRRAFDFLGDRAEDPVAWADLAHVLINSKEFIYIR